MQEETVRINYAFERGSEFESASWRGPAWGPVKDLNTIFIQRTRQGLQ